MCEAHENEYQRMKQEGIDSWMERNYPWAIDPHDQRFLEDVFAQSWVPQNGKVIELGCGTGALLRWLSKRGFRASGIDVSKTAIQMARAQSKEYNIKYRVDNICALDPKRLGRFDLCIDGRFLHCITGSRNRKAVLENVREIIKENGVFIVMTMCSPIDRRKFSNMYSNQRIRDNVIYAPTANGDNFEGSRIIEGTRYMPTRFVAHWRSLLSELRRAGFSPMLFRFNHCGPGEPVSSLNMALTKR